MRAQIKEKARGGEGHALSDVELLGREVDFEPGKYLFVSLPEAEHQDEKGLRRHITVATSPNEQGRPNVFIAGGIGTMETLRDAAVPEERIPPEPQRLLTRTRLIIREVPTPEKCIAPAHREHARI